MIDHYVDAPADGGLVQRHGFGVSGWIYDPDDAIDAVTVSAGDRLLGRTRLFFARADVNEHLGIDSAARTAFIVDCLVPNELRTRSELRISVEGVDTAGIRFLMDQRTVHFSLYDYRNASHGYQFDEDFSAIIPRESVYATGPPAPEASSDVIELLTRYIEPGVRTLDVGCGIGSVGRSFRKLGLPWVGCEIRPEFVEAARADGLDARLVENDRFPFEDGSFDAAFAIEVLEHIRDPHPFLREMRRVAPGAGYFSVPNFEAIPVTSAFYAIPWHMLEPDHWNFYARGSLKATLREYYQDVEVFEYGELQQLRALDGLPVFNHLFAVGRN